MKWKYNIYALYKGRGKTLTYLKKAFLRFWQLTWETRPLLIVFSSGIVCYWYGPFINIANLQVFWSTHFLELGHNKMRSEIY